MPANVVGFKRKLSTLTENRLIHSYSSGWVCAVRMVATMPPWSHPSGDAEAQGGSSPRAPTQPALCYTCTRREKTRPSFTHPELTFLIMPIITTYIVLSEPNTVRLHLYNWKLSVGLGCPFLQRWTGSFLRTAVSPSREFCYLKRLSQN